MLRRPESSEFSNFQVPHRDCLRDRQVQISSIWNLNPDENILILPTSKTGFGFFDHLDK